ncbi:uncharacterized protein YALI1_A14127g [Yarrowia lipolytica]|uniref:Uncharacterized protein n=1 Tax=Yarrowia lipolytica TaxID=4952 RepID=A0A1D8N4Q9_YARLL|nr:hypothetical protein YALI1_A14127g [Yarrowia lipolytica]
MGWLLALCSTTQILHQTNRSHLLPHEEESGGGTRATSSCGFYLLPPVQRSDLTFQLYCTVCYCTYFTVHQKIFLTDWATCESLTQPWKRLKCTLQKLVDQITISCEY